MSESRAPDSQSEVSRIELDELRRELASAREEIAQLKATRYEDDSRRPGPVMTNVLAGFIVAGGTGILVVTSNLLRSHALLSVWLGCSGFAGLVTALIIDHVNNLPSRRPEAVLIKVAMALTLGSLMADFIGGYESISTDENGGVMLLVSFAVGAAVWLSLTAIGWSTWLQRLWKL